MKEVQVISASNAAVPVTSIPYTIGDLREYSIHTKFSGALNGTLSIRVSNDKEDWVPIPESSQQVVSGASHMWTVMGAGYKHVQIAWVPTSGTGTLTAMFVLKEFPTYKG